MIYKILFLAVILATAVIAFIIVRGIRQKPLKPFARNLLIGIVLIEVFLAVMHLLAAQDRFPTYWNWFFDLQYERNLGAIFSSLQLMVIAFVAGANMLFTPNLKLSQRLYWLLLVVTFIYLSFDEFYAFHETFGGRVPTSDWEIPYAIGGGILFLISAAAFWFGFRKEKKLFSLMLVGIILLATGAVLMEKFVRDGFVEEDRTLRWMFVFEETFEMIGATVVLIGMLSYANEHLVNGLWQRGKRLVTAGGFAWAIWLFFSLLFLEALLARTVGTPVQIDYDNGLMSLVGYRITPDVLKPGEEVALTLYWKANQPISTDYSVSLHILSHPEVDSVAQSDDLHLGAIPSTAWFPGIVSSRTLYVKLPRNLPVPASYWLMLRVWSGPWPFGRPWTDTTGLPISNADNHQLISDDSVIVSSFPALPGEAQPAAGGSSYRFTTDNFSLEGTALPAETVQTHDLDIEFSWATSTHPTRDLTQFFHLIPQGGSEPFAFDQQPFSGRLPTRDWPANQRFTDQWTLRLPEDVPAGQYDVYTGLYDPITLERATVIDQSGQPVANNSIFLGTVNYAPDPEVEAALARQRPGLCYALSDSNSLNGLESDTLVMMNTETGEATEIAQPGTVKTEGVTFNADHSLLYVIDERDDVGLFGVIDPQTGIFSPLGEGIATVDNPANNPLFGESLLKDVDSLALEPSTGIIWGVHQDEENYLFQLDTETGTVVRDAFGEGYDYLKLDLSSLPAPGYINVKDMAVDPGSGSFYVVAGNDAFDSFLGRVDFETLDLDSGTIMVTPVAPLTSAVDNQPIRDMEALSFTPDGVLFSISTNNSNTPDNFDRLWRVDPTSGAATPVGRFTDYVDFVDYEAVACLDAIGAD